MNSIGNVDKGKHFKHFRSSPSLEFIGLLIRRYMILAMLLSSLYCVWAALLGYNSSCSVH